MKINPKILKENNFFYNNICLILIVFSAICYFTAFNLNNEVINQKIYGNLQEGSIYGPIKVGKNAKICTIKANMSGQNMNTYISGEVLDEDKDTLYEFGKDLWHEDGYDADGYWSESDRSMSADLTFSEAGIYYIQFNTDENSMPYITIAIKVKKGSPIPHTMMGTILLMIACVLFLIYNRKWLIEKSEVANEWLEEHCDD